MKKLLLTAAFILALPLNAMAAGYDISVKNMDDLTDEAAVGSDIRSTDFMQFFDTANQVSTMLPMTSVQRSAPPVSVTGTYSATCELNGAGMINYISSSGSNATVTLPAATGSGCEYKFVWGNVPTASGDVIQVTGNDEFRGTLFTLSDDTAGVKGWAAASGSDNDKMTFTSSTKFGATAGSTVILRDVATDVYQINGSGSSTGTEATPFATGQRS